MSMILTWTVSRKLKLTQPMPKYIVNAGQTLYDVALELYGSLEGIEQLAERNNIAIDSPLVAEQVLDYVPGDDNAQLEAIRAQRVIPNTGQFFSDVADGAHLADASDNYLSDAAGNLIKAD